MCNLSVFITIKCADTKMSLLIKLINDKKYKVKPSTK